MNANNDALRKLILEWRTTAIAYETAIRANTMSPTTTAHHRVTAVQLRTCAIALETALKPAPVETERDRREINRLRRAIRWALGEIGEFPTRQAGEGAYWWRKELRKRARL